MDTGIRLEDVLGRIKVLLLALEGGGDVSVNAICIIIMVKFTSELDPLPGGVLNVNFNLFRQVGLGDENMIRAKGNWGGRGSGGKIRR